jgi:arylformamidase
LKLSVNINDKDYFIDVSEPIEISVPINFNGEQPNTYDVEIASAQAYQAGDIIGDTRKGGSCNFEKYIIIPHCNGTHTECVGHITDKRIYINDVLKSILIQGELITVEPVNADKTKDNYDPKFNSTDKAITRESIEKKIRKDDNIKALMIRTLPNDDSKKSRRYMQDEPPIFSNDAMEFINELGIEHLLVDMPSVDRTFDEGKLTNHHIFWNVAQGSHETDNNHSLKTITEMIYASNEIKDGKYLVNIQIPDWKSDAAPSRVFLYELK